jgi:hypothetical protein
MKSERGEARRLHPDHRLEKARTWREKAADTTAAASSRRDRQRTTTFPDGTDGEDGDPGRQRQDRS